jgi:GAF domain-containing protein
MDQNHAAEGLPQHRMAAPGLAATSRELDSLLDELAEQLNEVRSSRDRLRGLLEAVLTVASDISTDRVLQHIVEAACQLIDARYGALGVARDGHLQQVVTVGMTEDEITRLGQSPIGKGVVGVLIRDRLPLRLDDLTHHPESCGVPPHHPPMKTFLGMPIKIRGEFFGNLYLTEKRNGDPFSPSDENVVMALAAAAGVAIENSRLLERSERQRSWAQAGAKLTALALSGAPVVEIRERAVQEAMSITGADETGLRVPRPGGDALMLVAGAGARTRELFGEEFSLDSPLGAVFAHGRPYRTDRLAGEPDGADLFLLLHAGPLLAVPLRSAERTVGVLSISRHEGAAPFEPEDLETVVEFGTHVAIALEYAASIEARELLLLLEERDRIARDLHDVVIQRLFATGMTLESVGGMATDAAVKGRISSAVD